MGGFKFHFEGPQEKRERELRVQEMETAIARNKASAEILDAEASRINPGTPGRTQEIQSIIEKANNPATSELERRALIASLGGRFGEVDTPAGKMPLFATSDMVEERQRNMFINGAQKLADAERAIRDAEQRGDSDLAAGLKTMRDNMFKGAKENFKKVPFDKLDELSNRRSFLDAAEKVASILQEEGSGSLYGPIDSFMGDLGGRTGIMTNDKYVELSQAFAATRNALLKELAGSAVTEGEAARQLESIGNLGRADFGPRFMSFYNQARRDFYNKVQTLNDSGFQIPERLITRSEQGVTTKDAPAATGQPQQSGQSTFQYDPRARRLIPGR